MLKKTNELITFLLFLNLTSCGININDGQFEITTAGSDETATVASTSAPTLNTNTTLTATDSLAYTISNTVLDVSDADTSDDLITFTITSAPVSGSITNTNLAITLSINDTFTMEDIENGYITYTYPTELNDDGSVSDTDAFQFTFSDEVGNSSSAETFNININHFCSDKSSATNHLAYPIGSPVYYHICSADQWNSIGGSAAPATDWTYNYKLRADIDMSSISGNHNIIGNSTNRFSGTFDGNNNKISNWNNSSTATNYIGIFGFAEGDGTIDDSGDGVFKNVTIIDATVLGDDFLGLLLGRGNTVVIENVHTSGNLTADFTGTGSDAGGVVGSIVASSSLTSSSSNVQINAQASTGGIAGHCDSSTISYSFSRGTYKAFYTVTGYIGGILGYAYGCSVSDSASFANIYSVGDYAGGLVGRGEAITRSYAAGIVVGERGYVGGLVGGTSGSIFDSYSISRVYANGDYVGGLTGRLYGTGSRILRSYATGDITVTGSRSYVGGLVGLATTLNNSAHISESYALGNVTATSSTYVGGLIGSFNGGTTAPYVKDSFARGNVAGSSGVGGLIGRVRSAGTESITISDSYASGATTGSTNLGGVIGVVDIGSGGSLTYSNLYYDSTVSTAPTDADGTTGASDPTGIAGQATSWLQDKSNLNGSWDWAGTGTETWVMPLGDDAANATDRYPELTTHYKCYDTAWTNSPSYEGAGTLLNPYIICAPAQLLQVQATSSDWDKYFRLGDSIDMTAQTWPDRLGNTTTKFTGTFDGNNRNGFVIDNFSFSHGNDSIGFISLLEGDNNIDGSTDGHIYNLSLTNAAITGRRGVGILTGIGSGNAMISFSNSSGTAHGTASSGGSYVGGLAGFFGGDIIYSSSSANITGASGGLGGLVGRFGFSGEVSDTELAYSYATGNVTAAADSEAGGLVGTNNYYPVELHKPHIHNCYATGNVEADDRVGGITGATINAFNSYNFSASTLTINSGSNIGGNHGYNNGSNNIITRNYWDITTSGTTSSWLGNGVNAPAEAEGYATATMRLEATYTNWDFDVIWTTNGDTTYPQFLWQ